MASYAVRNSGLKYYTIFEHLSLENIYTCVTWKFHSHCNKNMIVFCQVWNQSQDVRKSCKIFITIWTTTILNKQTISKKKKKKKSDRVRAFPKKIFKFLLKTSAISRQPRLDTTFRWTFRSVLHDTHDNIVRKILFVR